MSLFIDDCLSGSSDSMSFSSISAADGRPILTYSGGHGKPQQYHQKSYFIKYSVGLADDKFGKLNKSPPSNVHGHPLKDQSGIKIVFVDATMLSLTTWGNGKFDCAFCGGTKYCLPGKCGERYVFVAFARSGVITFEIHSVVMCDNAAKMLQKPSNWSAAETIKMWCDINRNTYHANKYTMDRITQTLKLWRNADPSFVCKQQMMARQSIVDNPGMYTIVHIIANGVAIVLRWSISHTTKWSVVDFIIVDEPSEELHEELHEELPTEQPKEQSPIDPSAKKFSDDVLLNMVASMCNESSNAWTSV